MKIDIDSRYIPTEEIHDDDLPYTQYLDMLDGGFDLGTDVGSFCDLGCGNGLLLTNIHDRYPAMDIAGFEYFAWQREAADRGIQDHIQVCDLRDPLNVDKKYDLVNCTDIAQHIDPNYSDTFFDNVLALANRYIITTWSSAGGIDDQIYDPYVQHLNPKSHNQYLEYVTNRGLTLDRELSQKLIDSSIMLSHFYPWWRDSLLAWRVS